MRIKKNDIFTFKNAPEYYFKVIEITKQSKYFISMATQNDLGEFFYGPGKYDKRHIKVIPKLQAILKTK